MSDHINPDQLREVLLKLEVTQFAKGELHVIKEDLREMLSRDLRDHRRELRDRNRWFIGIVLSTAAFIIGGDVWTVRDSVHRAQDAVNKEIEASRERSRETLAAEVQRIRRNVSDRLDQEFSEPHIRQLVEEKAREYTEVEARSYINAQVENSLKPFHQQVASAMGEISKQRDLVAGYQAKVGEAVTELNKRVEAANPLLQPIRTATATVEIHIDSDQSINTTFLDRGGYFALGRANKAVLAASGTQARAMQVGGHDVIWRAVWEMDASDQAVGKPVQSLKEAQFAQIQFFAMPNNSKVVRGSVRLTINSTTQLDFNVPPQQESSNGLILIAPLGAELSPLERRP
jgi:hypothetical protein